MIATNWWEVAWAWLAAWTVGGGLLLGAIYGVIWLLGGFAHSGLNSSLE